MAAKLDSVAIPPILIEDLNTPSDGSTLFFGSFAARDLAAVVAAPELAVEIPETEAKVAAASTAEPNLSILLIFIFESSFLC
jgi:hypothetical protein